MLVTRGPNPNSIREVAAMCAEGFEGVFCHNSRNLQCLDALVTERAWLTTILAARQYYYFTPIKEDR